MPTIPSVGRQFFAFAKMAVFSQLFRAHVRAVVVALRELSHRFKTLSRSYFAVRFVSVFIFFVLSFLISFYTPFSLLSSSSVAQAQTPNTTLNYQARILQASGSLVPDGNYHVEFKIYDSLSSGATAQGVCSGNCLWVETRTTGNLVRVVNGYVAVNLGSVTAFPSTMPWGQDLYVTIRIGGSAGAAAWDTEMTSSGNRMKITAVPVAFLDNNVGSGATFQSETTDY